MPDVSPARLHAFATAITLATGSSADEARLVADHLVEANLTGHDSHGVGMLPDYVRCVGEGLLVPNQTLKVLNDTGAVLLVDGGRGYGQAMAKAAMDMAIERAAVTGACVLGLRNSSHVGRIGHWAEQCARAGMVSIHFVNVADHDPLQAPYACSDARLGTNPFCVGIPGDGDRPALLLDMATSSIAFGKARVARNKGMPVPEGVLIDEHGMPTTDPTTYVDTKRGALLSFGLHKGSGLAILCEVLGAALTGGQTIQPGNTRSGGILNSMLTIVISPAAMGEAASIRAEVERVKDWVRDSPPAPGFSEVLLPGDPEARSKALRREAGIPVDDKTFADCVAAGVSRGLDETSLRQIAGVE